MAPTSPALFVMELPAPDIPGYTLKSILGTGGSATVYLAQHHALQRDVALKVMCPVLANDPIFYKRFLKEARDTALLSDHPNIVTIHDVGNVGSIYYIAMQYLPGQSLRQRLDTAGIHLPEPCDVLLQLAQALSQVHQKGFIHRDIKPGNVLFNKSGEAVLSDFGVARSTLSTDLTTSERSVGTLRYMSPEQIRGGPVIDARSDLYSLGVLFYEMLTHEPPYLSTEPGALMHMHLNDPIPQLPAELARHQHVLNKLMAKQTHQRYPSAKALLAELLANRVVVPESEYQQPAATTPEFFLYDDANSKKLDTHSAVVLGLAFTVLVLLTGSLLFIRTHTASAQPDQTPVCPELTLSQINERNDLLELAQIHRDIGRLMHPPGANAMHAYMLALEIDPCNQDVIDSVANIRHE